MLNYYKFTYIIPYTHSNNKLKILKKTLSWLIGFSNIEIILVENDTKSKIGHINLPVKYFFLKNNGIFNKAHIYNYAAKLASTNKLIFGSYNFIMDSKLLIDSILELNNNNVIVPYKKLYILSKEEVNKPINEILTLKNELYDKHIINNIILYNKNYYNQIGGYSEEFYATCDKLQEIKLNKLNTNIKVIDNIGYLLYDNYIEYEEISAIKVIEEFEKFDNNKVTSYIDGISKRIGLRNKYE